MTEKGILIVVSGFSGTGKGETIKRLMGKYPRYVFSISATTRSPREGEQHGREYFFLSKEEFEQKISEGRFLEHANYVGNYYGTPRDYVEEQLAAGRDVLLDIEVEGALNVKQVFPEAVLVYLLPPSAKELKRRLSGRGTETEDVIKKRMSRSLEESKEIEKYDYVVVNDELDQCVEELHGIVSSEHNRTDRKRNFIEHISSELQTYLKGENIK